MKAMKRRTIRAYNQAVYAELQKRGQKPDQALQIIRHYYRPLHRTWGLELNPEAFADEMLNLQKISIMPEGKTVTIKPYLRKHNGHTVLVRGHNAIRSTNDNRIRDYLAKSKAQLKVDSTGKVTVNRNLSR